jgi:hypothetical protein
MDDTQLDDEAKKRLEQMREGKKDDSSDESDQNPAM